MKTNSIRFNLNSLTASCNGKVTQYKSFHAYQTAFLANIVGKVFMSYDHYTKSFNKINKGVLDNGK
jgi:hypothetical protein